MPRILTLLLPIMYAILGGILWYRYGTGLIGVGLWLLVQIILVFVYNWLIGDKVLGLMLKFHLISMGLGMLILFYVLTPGKVSSEAGVLVFEVGLMIFGTFCCSVGLFSLLYMVIRKLINDRRLIQ